jgi:LysM repeat protein
VAVVLLADAPSGWSQQQYLCTPTAVEGEGIAQGKNGVLVQDVSVQKGDTLSGISRRFSGHGSYFPQILLFNDIKNPNLIYPGNVFKIPVSRHIDKSPVKKEKSASTGGKPAVPRRADTFSVKKTVLVAPAAAPAKKQATNEKKHSAAVGARESASSQNLFERAVKAYRQDDYRTALELFDRYLAENQASPLAADASLYKAECYLKLSVQN